jgi:hypothetical protein
MTAALVPLLKRGDCKAATVVGYMPKEPLQQAGSGFRGFCRSLLGISGTVKQPFTCA